MATTTRTLTRATQLLRPAFRRNLTTFAPRRPIPRPNSFPKNARFNSTSAATGGSKVLLYTTLATLAGAVGGGYYLHHTDQLLDYIPFLAGFHTRPQPEEPVVVKDANYKPTLEDYQTVYDEVAELLERDGDYDDGSYGPVLLRLAWHASGTYDKDTKTGGSSGATMRFAPESEHGANAGLKTARELLEGVKGTLHIYPVIITSTPNPHSHPHPLGSNPLTPDS